MESHSDPGPQGSKTSGKVSGRVGSSGSFRLARPAGQDQPEGFAAVAIAEDDSTISVPAAEMDALLDRLETGIAAERLAMNDLLARMMLRTPR
jgi:hypothetical protein